MTAEKLNRGQAAERYGEDFVRIMMRDKDEIDLTPKQRVLVQKWKMLKRHQFEPYAYEYVYVMSCRPDMFKIGMTRTPQQRLGQMNVHSPEPFRFYGAVIVGGQAGRNVERAAIEELKRAGKLVRGEWFKGDPETAIEWLREFAEVRYGDNLVSLSDAYEGCEPLMPMVSAMFAKDDPQKVERVKKYRRNFMWLLEKA